MELRPGVIAEVVGLFAGTQWAVGRLLGQGGADGCGQRDRLGALELDDLQRRRPTALGGIEALDELSSAKCQVLDPADR